MGMINREVYEIRPYRPEDKSFICATFLKGLYYGNDFYNLIQKDAFMEAYKAVIESLIANNLVSVMCLKDDIDVILGYSILSKDFNALHFVFVKAAWRKQSIMRSLIPVPPVAYTHFTTLGLLLAKKMYPNSIFNPFYRSNNE